MALLKDLIEKLQWLPGIGRKSAQRIAFYLQKMEVTKVEDLANAIVKSRTELKECSVCHNLSEKDPCEICVDDAR